MEGKAIRTCCLLIINQAQPDLTKQNWLYLQLGNSSLVLPSSPFFSAVFIEFIEFNGSLNHYSFYVMDYFSQVQFTGL